MMMSGDRAVSSIQMGYLRFAKVSERNIKLIAIFQLFVKASQLTSFTLIADHSHQFQMARGGELGALAVILLAGNTPKQSSFAALFGTGKGKLIAGVPVLFVLRFGAWGSITPRGGTTRPAF